MSNDTKFNSSKSPKVSVIIPTYNRANILPRTINSVLNQTFKDFELIIVDDCSTDNTKEIVEELQKKDKRIRYIRLDKNSGAPAHPKNVGIQNSKGQFIAFLDDDDEWLPEKLEKQLELFKHSNKKNLGFVSCNALIQEGDKTREYKTPRYENAFKELLRGDFIFSCSSMVTKKNVLSNIGFFDENLKSADDWDMWIRIAQKYDFDFVPEPLFRYYIHGGNISNAVGIGIRGKIDDIGYILNKYKEYYKKYPRIYSIKLRNLGSLYILSDDLGKARLYFVKAMKIAPWYSRSWTNLVVSLLGIRFYKRVLFYKEKIVNYLLFR